MVRQSIAIVALGAVALCGSAAQPSPAKRAEALFDQAQDMVRKNRRRMNKPILAKVEEAVKQVEKALAAGEEIGWKTTTNLKWAAERAREDLADYDKSLALARTMIKCDKRGGRKWEAQLEMAATYRALRDYKQARQLYDAIVTENPKNRSKVLLPLAEMVYFDIGDKKRGRTLLDEALMNEEVSGVARYRLVMDLAKKALFEGRRDEAMSWYGTIEKMPDARPKDHLRYLAMAWYEMGKIEQGRDRLDAAKTLYRKAMNLDGGQMSFRVRARDAIEGIEYFE